MSILVTGSSGFIGSHLVKSLVENGENVICLIHDDPTWRSWLLEALRDTVLVWGDIRNHSLLKRVINQYSVDRVFHLAAQSIVKKAYRDPVNVFDVNVVGTVKLLEACRQLDVKKIVVQSTDKIYGNQTLATVASPYRVTEIYGASKICVDVAAQSFIENYDMNIVISRMCNIYGLDYSDRIVPNTIRSCLDGKSPIIFRNDPSKRQYMHVYDAVQALIFLMDEAESGAHNVCGDLEQFPIMSQEEVVLSILQFFPAIKPEYVDKPGIKEIESQSMVPSINSTPHWWLNWAPKYLFEEGIKLTIDAYRKYGW